ncbi:TIPIN protein, partial [Anthoscopus minutus]|nr:TIPIN protein [Anthoscopus minutus]
VAMLDPLENNLFDLPDYENTEDETFPPLPPPASPGRDDAEWAQTNGDPDGNQQSQTKDSAVTTQKAVKRSRPRLDAQRLISERGLPALRHMFDNVKFKGKGHEVRSEDLKTLIQHMEHWAHRLFPKLQFEDFIDRVESLGSKKEVQTCLKRIRLDLPILHEDFKNNEEGEGSGPDAAAEDAHSHSGHAAELNSLRAAALTEEQQERMKKNRQLALERRQARLQGLSQSQQQELPSSYSEEEFDSPGAQDPTDLTEDTQVPAAKDAAPEDGDDELECAREEQ